MSNQHKTFIVAELSANHGQSYERAVELIHAASKAGADAIKLQTYTPDTITINHDSDIFIVNCDSPWDGQSMYEVYQSAYTPWEWQPKLKELTESLGLTFFSTPFDNTAVDFLENMNVELYKVSSPEIVDIPLLKKIGQTGKPVIMSTGMASLGEIEEAVSTLREVGCTDITLLKCTTAYPAPPEEANLNTIPNLAETFGVKAGLSDHSLGISLPIAAVSLGASVIEKHFTLSRGDDTPDAAFSLVPQEFEEMVTAIRTIEKALGQITYRPTAKQHKSVLNRRSLFVVKDIKAGEIFTQDNVRSIRPGQGLHTRHYESVLGARSNCDITKGTPLQRLHISQD